MVDQSIAISSPNEVFKQLKSVSVDIKTDRNYQNAMRLSKNLGY